jgi:hypothetical protein
MRLPWDMMVPPDVIVFRQCKRSDLSAEAQRAKAEAIQPPAPLDSSLTLLAMAEENGAALPQAPSFRGDAEASNYGAPLRP